MKIGLTIKDLAGAGLRQDPSITISLLSEGSAHVEVAGGFAPDYSGVMLVCDTLEDIVEALRSLPESPGRVVESDSGQTGRGAEATTRPGFNPVSLSDGKPV